MQIPNLHNQRLLEIELSEEPKEEPKKKEKEPVTEPDALADPEKAEAKAPDAPKVQSNSQPKGTPQYSYEAKMNARSHNAEVIGK